MSDYSGWKNYETWITNLWLSYDESYWCFLMNEAKRRSVDELAKFIENEIDESVECILPECGLLKDLLTSSLNEVNWREIAEHLVEEDEEDEDDEEENDDE